MLRTSFTLISKRSLTHDVYELIYSCPELTKEPPKPGQYVMFQLAPGLNRAYSIAGLSLNSLNDPTIGLSDQPTITLIIKRIGDGRGSPMICDAEVGTSLQGIIPLGHFTLQNTSKNKCFIGTGTGFAPLYCQLLGCLPTGEGEREKGPFPICSKVAFIFGVRNFQDSFYENEIETIGSRFDGFEYLQYFSRESQFPQSNNLKIQKSGYVTDWINHETIHTYEEFYICGSPAMVKSAREKLESLGVPKEAIFWEQF